MSSFRFVTLFLAFSFTGSQFADGQERVDAFLTVVEIDKSGERRAVNQQVTIIPKNKGVFFKRTNSNGQVNFSFAPTESVTFRVGEIGNDIRMQPLSGRTSQNTSFLIDKRSSRKGFAAPVSVSVLRTSTFFELLSDLELQSGGRLMTQQSREYLQSLRPAIIKATTADPNASEYDRKSLADAQSQLLTRMDEMLKAPFRMGVNLQDSTLGARVASVQQGGPADVAGLKLGDIITHVDYSSVVDSPQTIRWLIANSPEAKTNVKVIRGTKELQFNISLTR